MKKYIHILIVVLSVFAMNSCSGDAEMLSTSKEQNSVSDYKFVINVSKGDNASTRAVNKTEWVEGDVIVAITNGDMFSLIYQNDGYWKMEGQSPYFSDSNGTIFACYGLTDSWNIEPELFLYTDEGSYAKSNDVVFINLDMKKRPFARLIVKGIGKDFSIAKAKAPRLVSMREMILTDTTQNATAAEYDESTQTAIYYGIVAPTNNQTEILLYNADGLGYSRIYNKTMKCGESIVLNGPNSSEADLWTKHILVKKITLNEVFLNAFVDETYDLVANVDPLDAENADLIWSSSDTNVADVDANGHVTINGVGKTLITVATKDGTNSVCCGMNVSNHASLSFENLVQVHQSGTVFVRFHNGYDKDVRLKHIYWSNQTTGEDFLIHDVSNQNLQISSQYCLNLNFTGLSVGYYNLKADYECNGKEYTILSDYAMEVR